MENNLQFTITAQDLATKSLAQIRESFNQFVEGSVQGGKRLEDSHRRIVDSGNRVVQLYREQRMENRMQSFYFRESSGLVGAFALGLTSLSGSMGNTTESMKNLNASLNQGFVAFQGIDFALAALGVGGPWALAAAGVAGLGAAFATFVSGKSAQEAKAQIDAASNAVKEISSAINSLDKDNIGAIRELLKFLQGGSTRSVKTEAEKLGEKTNSTVDALAMGLGGVKLVEQTNLRIAKDRLGVSEKILKLTDDEFIKRNQLGTVVLATADSEERIKKNQEDALDKWTRALNERVRLREIENNYLGSSTFKAAFDPTVPQQYNKELQIIGLTLADNNKAMAEFEAKNRRKLEDTSPRSPVQITPLKPPGAELRTPVNDLIDGFKQLGTTAENVNSLIISSTQGAAAAITDAFFGATQSIGKFFENMVKEIVRLITEQLLVKGILNLLGGLFGGGIGAAFKAAGAGGLFGDKTIATRNTTEEITNKTIAKTAEVLKESTVVKNVSRNVTNVNENVRNVSAARPDVRVSPVFAKHERAVTLNINVNGNVTSTRKASIADRRAITQAIEDALFSEKIGR